MKKLGRHEGRVARLRRVAVVERGGDSHERVCGSRSLGLRAPTSTTPSTSAPPTSGRSSSGSRTRAPTGPTCRSTPTPTSPSCRVCSRTASTMKANVLATGYGQALLDQPLAKTIKPSRRHHHRVPAARARRQGRQAVHEQPEEVRRAHRDPGPRHLHRLHHLRHGHPGSARPQARTRPARASSTACAVCRTTTAPGSPARPLTLSAADRSGRSTRRPARGWSA